MCDTQIYYSLCTWEWTEIEFVLERINYVTPAATLPESNKI